MTAAATRARATAAVGWFLLAAAVRLPGLGERPLGSAEQVAFVESQGFSTRATVPAGRPIAPEALPRRTGLLAIAQGATVPPAHAAGLALWTRLAGTSETALRLPSALTGATAAALAALVAFSLAGPGAAAWAGGLVALSPIHALSSRNAGPEAVLVCVLLVALAALVRVEGSGDRFAAALLGLALGVLAGCGVAAFAAVAVVPLAWLLARADRRAAAGLASTVTLAVVGLASGLGLFRSPLDLGEIPSWIPEASASGLLRCTGASFTRVAGLEYHLVVSHARFVVPLTALFVGLMALGAARLPSRVRWLLVAGAVLPFAFGATLALATGRVMPLQASRLVAALPFVALLMAAGLASLRGGRAWAAGVTVGGALVAFLSLALARPGYETSPARAVAREIAPCRGVVAVQRPFDLLALAAWDVPGPFLLRSPGAPPPEGDALVVGPTGSCVSGRTACGSLPRCSGD